MADTQVNVEEVMGERPGWRASDNPAADLKLVSSDRCVFWVSSETLALYSRVYIHEEYGIIGRLLY